MPERSQRVVLVRHTPVSYTHLQEAAVYLNGVLLGRHMGGYNAFTLDATDALVPRNTLLVLSLIHICASARRPSRAPISSMRPTSWPATTPAMSPSMTWSARSRTRCV